ncbi:P-selectin [Hipposideros larvatus]
MASCLKTTWSWRVQSVVFGTAQLLCFSALMTELMNQNEVAAWTYNYSSHAYTWSVSRNFCKRYYTDLVAIQNKNEITYLNDAIPYYQAYYWIGIRKINNTWTWVGTKKALTEEAENWADNEPNNKKNNQDCVEIYIKRSSAPGKWNDEPCGRRKRALCYTASCHDTSCSKQGECVETIGNYSCSCYPGFYGPECEYAITCEPLENLVHGSVECSLSPRAFQYNTNCSFRCAEGFELRGADTVRCADGGQWTAPAPVCQALPCRDLTAPNKAQMSCSHPLGTFKYQSTCRFSCDGGLLLVGASELQCLATGAWSAPSPKCQAITCTPLLSPQNGTMTCVQPLGDSSSKSTCQFTCDEGFSLSGPERLDCTPSGHWTGSPPMCEAIRCPELSAPERGSLHCSDVHGEFNVGSTCQFSCHKGFKLEGANNVKCTASGRWTALPPTCEGIAPAPTAEVRCPALLTPGQGTMSCRHRLGIFGLNTTCYFGCKAGFTLLGDSALRCRPSGQWTAVTPACRAVKCSKLHITEPIRMNCSNPWGNFSYGSSCIFHCPEGQLLNGSVRTACQENGQWSTAMPTCQAGPLTIQEALTYFGGAVASTTGLVMGGTLLALLRKRFRQKDDGKSPLNPQSHLGTYGVFTNAAFDANP